MLALLAILCLQEPSFWDRDRVLGDRLEGTGVSFTLELTTEILSNVSGGKQRDVGLGFLLDWTIDVDLNQALGWTGGSFRTDPLWLQGDGISENIGDLTRVSNINGRGGVRVYETWLQQVFLDKDVSVRAGILAADQEFAITQSGLLYCNSVFGGPVFLTSNLPWPIYPVGALGLRLRLDPAPGTYVQAAVYDGEPGSEESNPHGFQMRIGPESGAFTIAETGCSFGECCPTTVKFGAFYHSGEGLAMGGGYGLVEQRLVTAWRLFSVEAPGNLEGFLRMGGTPSDRARVEYGLDAGLNAKGFIPGRPDDVIGLGLIYARLGRAYIAAQSDPAPWDHEIILEATAKLQFVGWASLQPDLQYVVHPGGTSDVKNALVLGLRLNVNF